MGNIIAELKRRRVFGATAAYAMVAFILMQLGEIVFPAFHLPDWALQTLIILLIIGFPLVAILSWFFDITPRGLVRTDDEGRSYSQTKSSSSSLEMTMRKSRRSLPTGRFSPAVSGFFTILIVFGVVAGSWWLHDRENDRDNYYSASASERALAVFNFENLSDSRDANRLGQILQELIITDLSDLSHLKVFSSQRLFDIQKQIGERDSRVIDPAFALRIARQAGASTLLTGSIFEVSGKKVVTSRLLDVEDGAVIKSRKVEGDDIYAMVDQLTHMVKEDLNLPATGNTFADVTIRQKTTTSMDAFQYYLEGVDLLNQQEYMEAIDRFERAVSIDQNFNRAWYKMAVAQWWASSHGDLEMDVALTSLKHYMESDIRINNEEKFMIDGMRKLVNRNFKEAITVFRDLVELRPDNKEYWYNLGEAYFHGQDDYLKALDAFERALDLNPDFSLAYIHIFDIYRDQEFYDRGARLGEQYVQSHPNHIMGYDQLSTFYMRLGHLDRALEIIAQGRQFVPEHTGLQYNEALCRMYSGEFDRSQQLFSALIKDSQVSPLLRNKIRYSIVHGYALLGQYRQAAEFLLDFSYPDKMRPLEGDDQEKIWITEGYIDAGTFYSFGGYPEKSEECYRLAMEQAPFPKLKVSIAVWQGMAQAMLHNKEDLQPYIDQANDYLHAAKDAEVQEDIVHVLEVQQAMANGNYEEAIRMSSEIQESKTIRDWQLYQLGLLYLNTGQYDKALQIADRMQTPTVNPNSYFFTYPRAFILKGKIYQALGNPDAARDNYRNLLELWQHADSTCPELDLVRQAVNQLESKLS